jgi:hypothetical protein
VNVLVAILVTVGVVVAQRSQVQDGADHGSTAPAGPGYSFERTNPSGSPVRWDPCEPVRYVTNLAAAPSWGATDLQDAIGQVSAATGITFVDEGSTTVFPGNSWTGLSERRKPSPVIIAWASTVQSAALKALPGHIFGTELGRTRPVALINRVTGHAVYVTGAIVIDASASRLPQGFGPGGIGDVLLHELGHLMGLSHTSDTAEIMFPEVLSTKAGTYGTGDLAGLRRLGKASGCLNVPSYRS